MSTNKHDNSGKIVWITCGLFFFAYGCGYYHLINNGNKPKADYSRHDDTEVISKFTYNDSNHSSNTVNSGQRTRKIIKSIKVVPTTQTYEVSRWVTSGDWSQDNYPLTVTIPSQRVVMDIDYVEDHWDDFLSDPEDEIAYPPDIFQ